MEKNIPRHTGIIMDGNGRWAASRKAIRAVGHRKGTENVRTAISFARASGIKALSLFAFSTENWKRPTDEVTAIMELAVEFLAKETPELKASGVRLRFAGIREGLPARTLNSMAASEEATKNESALDVLICLNYGGRSELALAAKALAEQAAQGELDPSSIGEEAIARHLFAPDMGDLDLLIRTGAEKRLSNFMLWQAAYAEIYFTDELWPDFGEESFQAALDFYDSRQRRFGGLA
ncbi:MAG: polyprenyl diphosphate synthase [Eubacteriaceae bacterium]|nr:polyprenyl diphosphate synthase [Eubacteriaceae bacterium]